MLLFIQSFYGGEREVGRAATAAAYIASKYLANPFNIISQHIGIANFLFPRYLHLAPLRVQVSYVLSACTHQYDEQN